MFVELPWREAWAVRERRYLKKDSTELCRVIIFGGSRPKNKSLEIMLFETSKIITHPVEPIDIALRE
ncbi:hypothetical protein ES703_59702 [subsurface metagenome]